MASCGGKRFVAQQVALLSSMERNAGNAVRASRSFRRIVKNSNPHRHVESSLCRSAALRRNLQASDLRMFSTPVNQSSNGEATDAAANNPPNPNCQTCGVVASDSACWSCGTHRQNLKDIFCRSCGSIQPPVKCSYFELLGVPRKFDLDMKELEANYKQLMRKLHPDKFMLRCGKQREFSSDQATTLNVAYRTLKSPYTRAVYMLREMGIKFEDEGTSAADPEFMSEVLEVSSEIQDMGGDQKKLEAVKDEFYEPKLQECLEGASAAFSAQDAAAALAVTVRLQYLKRVGEMLGDSLQVQ